MGDLRLSSRVGELLRLLGRGEARPSLLVASARRLQARGRFALDDEFFADSRELGRHGRALRVECRDVALEPHHFGRGIRQPRLAVGEGRLLRQGGGAQRQLAGQPLDDAGEVCVGVRRAARRSRPRRVGAGCPLGGLPRGPLGTPYRVDRRAKKLCPAGVIDPLPLSRDVLGGLFQGRQPFVRPGQLGLPLRERDAGGVRRFCRSARVVGHCPRAGEGLEPVRGSLLTQLDRAAPHRELDRCVAAGPLFRGEQPVRRDESLGLVEQRARSLAERLELVLRRLAALPSSRAYSSYRRVPKRARSSD